MRLDFHLHTRLSDGGLSPAELLAAVRRARLDCWAVTAHDTLAGYQQLRHEPGIVPGVEVTAGRDGHEVHIVALGFAPDDAAFAQFLAGIRALRERRLTLIIADLGLAARLPLAALREGGAEALTRHHLAQVLVRIGRCASVAEAFADCLSDGQLAGLALPPYPTPEEAGAAIRAAGGVAILAHPGIYGDRAAIEAQLPGCDGLEIKHPNLDAGLAAELTALARARGLLASCGSDLHYLGARQPGDCQVGAAEVAPLLARIRR